MSIDFKPRPITAMLEEGWSHKLAWIAGVVCGDGHCSYDPPDHRRSITVTGGELDKEKGPAAAYQFLCRWRDAVDPTVNIHPRKDQVLNWYVELGCKPFAEWLHSYGWYGNKARSIQWPSDLPEELAGSFIRGVWDSDGTSHAEYRSTASLKYAFSLSMRAEALVRAVAIRLPIEHKVSPRLVKGEPMWTIEFIGPKGVENAKAVYGDAPASMRHESKWQAFVQAQEYFQNGCSVCHGKLHRRGMCRTHYLERCRPKLREKAKCVVCRKLGTFAKGLCSACYVAARASEVEERVCPSCGSVFRHDGKVELSQLPSY